MASSHVKENEICFLIHFGPVFQQCVCSVLSGLESRLVYVMWEMCSQPLHAGVKSWCLIYFHVFMECFCCIFLFLKAFWKCGMAYSLNIVVLLQAMYNFSFVQVGTAEVLCKSFWRCLGTSSGTFRSWGWGFTDLIFMSDASNVLNFLHVFGHARSWVSIWLLLYACLCHSLTLLSPCSF